MNRQTKDQIASIMLQHGTPEQKAEALAYASVPVLVPLKDRIADLLFSELGDSYDCTRAWSAWSYGTMTADDFDPVPDRLDDIVEALMAEIERRIP